MSICRIDANSLLAVFDTVLNDRQKINLIVSSKHPRPQWFSADEAQELVDKGLKIIDWASTDQGGEPDVVFALQVQNQLSKAWLQSLSCMKNCRTLRLDISTW